MIDLHNHILPALDDGAGDLAESLTIARQFASEGVVTAVATPHFNPERPTGPNADVVTRTVQVLQSAIEEAGIELRVLPGHELYLTPDVPALLAEGVALSLGGTRSALVEASLNTQTRPPHLDETLFRLQVAGYQPILAHPERYPFVQRDVTCLDEVRQRGVVLQLTAPALLGEYGSTTRRVAERLLRRGAYGLASSDRHHPGPTRSLQDLHSALTRLHGSQAADVLVSINPARLLAGEALSPLPEMQSERPGLLGRILGR